MISEMAAGGQTEQSPGAQKALLPGRPQTKEKTASAGRRTMALQPEL